VTHFEDVARLLATLIRVPDAEAWLRLVATVTVAPSRLDHGQPPRRQVRELTEWADQRDQQHQHEQPIAPVARYVACSWMWADPLAAPHWRWLLDEMASELDQIARYSAGDGLTVLRDEARLLRDVARRSWRDIEEFWGVRIRLATGLASETDRGAIRWQ
jgi:hypothetical protein